MSIVIPVAGAALLAGGAFFLGTRFSSRKRAIIVPAGRVQFRNCPNCTSALEKRMFEGHEKLACPACEFVYWNNPIAVGVALIPAGENGIVLVKRGLNPRKGYWALPGGFGEPFEHPKKTSKRESKEEVTLDVIIARLLEVDSPPDANQVLVFYVMEPLTPDQTPEPGSDALEAKVFQLDELPELAFSTHAAAIELYKAQRAASR